MVSAFNVVNTPPRDFHYLDLEINPRKFAMYCQAEAEGRDMGDLYLRQAKVGIRDPKMDADVLTERTYCDYAEARKTVEVQPESTPTGEVSE